VRVELGAPVVLAEASPALWHVPRPEPVSPTAQPTLCGLAGGVFAYRGPIVRARRLCGVCRRRGPAVHHDPTAGELAELVRRGGRPKGSVRRLTVAQVRMLHRLYVDEQLSTHALGALVWRQAGYASAKSAGRGVWQAFRELGLPVRTQSEATSLRNTRHGRCTRELRAAGGDHGPDGYRQWFRREQARYRPVCAGVRTQYPGKGQPCTRPAMAGSDYCWSHDPTAAAERDAHLEAMRARRRTLEAAA
jgi:hypothetical protein